MLDKLKKLYIFITSNINIYSIIITVVLDLIWNVPEVAAVGTIIGVIFLPILIAVIFSVCFIIVTLIQHYISKDDWTEALIKGAVLGIIAAVPFSVIGTIFGAVVGLLRLILGYDKQAMLTSDFLREWRHIERKVNRMSDYCPPDAQTYDRICSLYKKGYITLSQFNELNTIRSIRNNLVHPVGGSYPENDLTQSIINAMKSINNRL